MAKILLKLDIISSNVEMVKIRLMPPIIDLKKENLTIYLNNDVFNNFNIIENSYGTGKEYSIVFEKVLDSNDFITIQIFKDSYYSEKYKIYFSKYFTKNKADMFFVMPENKSGRYNLKIITVNDESYNIKSSSITICRPLNVEECKVTLEGCGTYHVDEEIKLNIELKTIDDEMVPDGYYLVKVKPVPKK